MIVLEICRNVISRLHAKAEELENLVNAEATDIEEVLTMINGMQVSTFELWGLHFCEFWNTKYINNSFCRYKTTVEEEILISTSLTRNTFNQKK